MFIFHLLHTYITYAVHYNYLFFLVYSITFKDLENQKIVTRVIKEVQGLNPSFTSADIRSKELLCVTGIIF